MNEPATPSTKITMGLILSWVFGVLFALAGIVAIFSEPLTGLVMLVMAAVLLPPVVKLVDQKWKFHLSGGVKIVVVIIGLSIVGLTNNTSDSRQANTNIAEQQNTTIETASDGTSTTNNVNQEQPPTETSVQNETKTETTPTLTNTNQNPTPEPEPTTTPAPTPEPTPEPAPTSTETVSQKNAVAKAKTYLSVSAFSHDGLVDQLEYEKFSHSDAVYGADNSGANWNEQAAKKAQTYMEISDFSRGGLIDQLKYDQFTQAQAEYGADAVGL